MKLSNLFPIQLRKQEQEMLKKIKKIIIGFLAVWGALAILSSIAAGIFIWASKTRLPEKILLEAKFQGSYSEDVPNNAAARVMLSQKPVIRDVVEALETASRDDRVKGLIARIGNVRMGMGHLQEVRDAVAAFRKSGKPAIAFADSFGELSSGNGGYYLATAFDEIYIQPSGDVGLTGLLSQSPFVAGTLKKLDIEPRMDHRKEYKSYMNMFTETEYTEPHREAVTAVVESMFNQMVRGIARGRALSEADVRERIDRGPFIGEEALEAKLVDGLVYWDEAEEKIQTRAGRDAATCKLSTYFHRAGRPYADGKTIALIYGEGGVRRGRSDYNPVTGSRTMGSNTVAGAFRSAIEDKDVKAILFRVNSPGGSYVGSDTIRREVARAGKAGKPVIVSMSNVAGSGGYFVAMDAHAIVAQPGTITGSIGVLGGKMVTREFWNKLGVSFDSVQMGENAGMWSSIDDYSPKEWSRVQTWLDRVYADFTKKVARGRHLDEEKVLEIAKGRIWSGEDALRLGLVDALGGFDKGISLARDAAGISPKEGIRLKRYPERKSPLDLLLNRGDAGLFGALAGWMDQARGVGRVLEKAGLLSDQFSDRVSDHRPLEMTESVEPVW